MTDDHKQKIREALRGRKLSSEHLQAIRDASAKRRGVPLSEEYKNKISKALKGRSHSEEHNKKVSQSLTGHPVSQEQREKQRIKNTKYDAITKILVRKEQAREWHRTHPEYMRTQCSLRRSRLYNNRILKPSKTERLEIDRFYILAKYLTESSGVKYHVDHIIPISKGGLHKAENLQVITAKENFKKGNRVLAGNEIGLLHRR